jgi:DNA-binding IclR family transcriptional regulator
MSNGTQKSAGREPQGGVQSVDRAITVLEILARDGQAGVSDVAAEIGVHKSTAFRLLAALEDRDLVEQDRDRGKYHLAFGILRLASAIPARIDMVRQAQPVLDALALELNETINLAVVREHFGVNVQQAHSSAAVASQNWVGRLTPLHATSSGKVLLAHMPDEQRDAIIDEAGLPELTEYTTTSRKVLLEELARVRDAGFASTFEELEIGLNASAVPVRDHAGAVVGALSASGPAYRFDKARIEETADDLKRAGDQISHRMGWLSQHTP